MRILSTSKYRTWNNLFIASLKTQVELKFLEKAPLVKRNKEALVLLPMLAKFNKRKLLKISKFLENETPGRNEKFNLLLNLLAVEKFLKVQELLTFFDFDREALIEFLLRKEIQKEIKIIDLTHLSITTFENVQNYLRDMNIILTDAYTKKISSLPFSNIESILKVPQSSLFFKYLLGCSRTGFSFKICKDKIVFQKLALSESEKGSLEVLENILKENKLTVFSIANLLKSSKLLRKEINQLLWFLIESEQVVQLNEEYYIFKEELGKIINKLKKYKRNQGEMIDIQSFRDLTLFSRRYIIVLFEYLDFQGITQRVNNHRKILLTA